MQEDKKLTLQQYIECHNIKKQLRQRSKEKQRSKSRDRATSLSIIPIDNHDTSIPSPKRSSQNPKISTHQIISNTLYDQVDYRARNLYAQLQQAINEIKLQCRAIIKNDKDFAFFLKQMDALTNKFRAAVMHIHRENILMFQMSKEAEKINSNEKDDLARSHIQNLEKSFNEQYELSKSQYQSNLNFVSHKTIKQKMQENKKSEQMVKALFGGLAKGPDNQNKVLKKYDTAPKDQKQRQQRKQQAVGFLGFIMRNIASTKKSESNSPVQQNLQSNGNSPSNNLNLPPKTNETQRQKSQNHQKQNTTTSKDSLNKNNNQDKNIDTKPKKEEEKIVKEINYLNSHPKPHVNTQNIDQIYSEKNLSFQTPKPSPKSIQNLKVSIPKSAVKNGQKIVHRVMNAKVQKTSEKVTSPRNGEKEGKRQSKNFEQKYLHRKKMPQGQSATSPPTNRVQLLQRMATKSKGKRSHKVSETKNTS